MTSWTLLSLPLWLATTSLAVSNFNRTVWGINPGLKFAPHGAIFVANDTAKRSSEGPPFWSLDFNLLGDTARYALDPTGQANETLGVVEFRFNGTGVQVLMSLIEASAGQAPDASTPSLTLTSTADIQKQVQVPMSEVVTGEDVLRAVVAIADTDQAEWHGELQFPLDSRWRLDSITYKYNLPEVSGYKLQPMEIQIASEGQSIQKHNASWVSDALSAGKDMDSPRVLSDTAAVVSALPDNTTFVSILGPRFRTPGDGGECRFAFDPPVQFFSFSHNDEGRLNYTYVDLGNPYFVNLSYPDGNITFADPTKPDGKDVIPSKDDDRINNTALLNQQLDPRIRYRIALMNGPQNSSLISSGADRISGGACEWDRVLAWGLFADETTATASKPGATRTVFTTSADLSTTHLPSASGSTGVSGDSDREVETQRNSLSSGAIAGIVVGVVVGVLLLCALAAWLVWRRRRHHPFSGDLSGDVQDDTKGVSYTPTPYIAPPASSYDTSEMTDEPTGSSTTDPAAVVPIGKAPRSTQRQRRRRRERGHRPRAVQHEEDAGAIPLEDSESESESASDVDVLPPMYREEWSAAPSASRRSRRRRSAPRSGGPSEPSPGITPEEIKYLGQPVSPPRTGSHTSNSPSRGERKYPVGGSSAQSQSQSSHETTPEDAKFVDALSTPPGAEAEGDPYDQQLKGKGLMAGEKDAQ